MPRCVRVTKRQRLKIINRAGVSIRVTLGPFTIRIRPGAEGISINHSDLILRLGFMLCACQTVTPGRRCGYKTNREDVRIFV